MKKELDNIHRKQKYAFTIIRKLSFRTRHLFTRGSWIHIIKLDKFPFKENWKLNSFLTRDKFVKWISFRDRILLVSHSAATRANLVVVFVNSSNVDKTSRTSNSWAKITYTIRCYVWCLSVSFSKWSWHYGRLTNTLLPRNMVLCYMIILLFCSLKFIISHKGTKWKNLYSLLLHRPSLIFHKISLSGQNSRYTELKIKWDSSESVSSNRTNGFGPKVACVEFISWITYTPNFKNLNQTVWKISS